MFQQAIVYTKKVFTCEKKHAEHCYAITQIYLALEKNLPTCINYNV